MTEGAIEDVTIESMTQDVVEEVSDHVGVVLPRRMLDFCYGDTPCPLGTPRQLYNPNTNTHSQP